MIKSKKLIKFKNIRHGFFDRRGGVSKGIYKSLNCGFGSNDKIKDIRKNLEKVCIDCVETGSMTKDLAILVGPSSKYLTTNQFLDVIDQKLKKKLN